MMEITQRVAQKVLDLVDCGLTNGIGIPQPGAMCVEAVVCYAMGEPHGDQPSCVDRCLNHFKIVLNDSDWDTKQSRARGMRRLALAQLGSAGNLNRNEFMSGLSILVDGWIEQGETYVSADPVNCGKWFNSAAESIRRFEEYDSGIDKAENAAFVARYVARVAWAAAFLGNDDNIEKADLARDQKLAEFAEDVVQLLIRMKVPGTQWLGLT